MPAPIPVRVSRPRKEGPADGSGSTPAALTTDQRGAGFARIFGPIIDIGAIEVQPIPYPLASAGTSNITTAGATAYTFTVTYFDAGAANNGINMSTVIGNNSAVRVLGPDGFNVPAPIKVILEVQQHLGEGRVRCVAMEATDYPQVWEAIQLRADIILLDNMPLNRIKGSIRFIKAAREALKSSPSKSEITVYPEAPHGFHADYRPSYRKEDAQDAWSKAIAWFKSHGAG